MKRTVFQHPELRDANDNIIQQGAFGKNTALANSTNDGWIDYVANDLEVLYDAQTAAGNAITTGGLTVSGKTTTGTLDAGDTTVTGTVTTGTLAVSGKTTTGTLEASSATVTGQTTTGTLAAGDTTVTGSITTTGLTVTGETSVPTANAGNSSKAIANTEFVQGELTNYLPLSGGTLTGVVDGVTPTAGDNSTKIATTEFVTAKARNYLPLAGGNITGSLTVSGKEVERVYASGSNYIRYESGLQLCWGELHIPAGTSGREVSGTMTFQYPFANTNYGLTFGNDWCASSTEYYRAEGRNTTNFKFTAVGVNTNIHKAFYLAIGYWK